MVATYTGILLLALLIVALGRRLLRYPKLRQDETASSARPSAGEEAQPAAHWAPAEQGDSVPAPPRPLLELQRELHELRTAAERVREIAREAQEELDTLLGKSA